MVKRMHAARVPVQCLEGMEMPVSAGSFQRFTQLLALLDRPSPTILRAPKLQHQRLDTGHFQ